MTAMERFSTYWQDTVNFLLGVGLFFSPWLFGYESVQNAAWNAHIVGVIIAVMALITLFAFQSWEEWVSGVLGLWLIISPWLMGFGSVIAPAMTHVLIGLAVVVLAIWSATEHGSGHLTT